MIRSVSSRNGHAVPAGIAAVGSAGSGAREDADDEEDDDQKNEHDDTDDGFGEDAEARARMAMHMVTSGYIWIDSKLPRLPIKKPSAGSAPSSTSSTTTTVNSATTAAAAAAAARPPPSSVPASPAASTVDSSSGAVIQDGAFVLGEAAPAPAGSKAKPPESRQRSPTIKRSRGFSDLMTQKAERKRKRALSVDSAMPRIQQRVAQEKKEKKELKQRRMNEAREESIAKKNEMERASADVAAVTRTTNKRATLAKQLFVVIRGNLLFVFKKEDSSEPIDSCNIEGCEVEFVHVNKGNMDKRNLIRVSHPSRSLIDGSKEFFIWVVSAADIERWYEALYFGSHGTVCANRLGPQIELFSGLMKECAEVGNTSAALAAVNAFAHRVWYTYHKHPMFKRIFSRLADEKLASVRVPHFVRRLYVTDFDVGPVLPIVTAAKLHSMSDNGEVSVDCQFRYAGGFHMVIRCVLMFNLFFISRHLLQIPLSIDIVCASAKGHARIKFAAPPSPRLWFQFIGEPELNLRIDAHLVALPQFSMLRVLPVLSEVIHEKVRDELYDSFVYPEQICIALPLLSSARKPIKRELKKKRLARLYAELKGSSNSSSAPTTTASATAPSTGE